MSYTSGWFMGLLLGFFIGYATGSKVVRTAWQKCIDERKG